MLGDWLKLHRKVIESEVFLDHRNPFLFKLWIWCLCKANYAPGVFHGETIGPGQFVTGRDKASKELKQHASRVYRCLKRLSDMGNITLKSNSLFTIVTVCNWKSYQSLDDSDRTATEQRPNSDRTATEQPANTIEEGKKERIKELIPAAEAAKEVVEKKPRQRGPRDDLFDAVAEVARVDPSRKSMGGRVGKAVTDLLGDSRPFTPEEVRALPGALRKQQTPEFVLKMTSSPELIVKHIHHVRTQPMADPGIEAGRLAAQRASAEAREIEAQRAANLAARQNLPDCDACGGKRHNGSLGTVMCLKCRGTGKMRTTTDGATNV